MTETTPHLDQEVLQAIERAKALIFDCDGTLVATPPLYNRAWERVLRGLGKEMAPDWFWQRAGLSDYMIMDEIELEHGIRLDRPQTVKRLREDVLSQLTTLEEIAEVAHIARTRKGTMPMAVASGGARAMVHASLESTRLTPLFSEIVTMDDVGRGKPFPDLFLEAARRLQVNPADCLVFEDTEQGLLAARRAGMAAIDIRTLTAAAGINAGQN